MFSREVFFRNIAPFIKGPYLFAIVSGCIVLLLLIAFIFSAYGMFRLLSEMAKQAAYSEEKLNIESGTYNAIFGTTLHNSAPKIAPWYFQYSYLLSIDAAILTILLVIFIITLRHHQPIPLILFVLLGLIVAAFIIGITTYRSTYFYTKPIQEAILRFDQQCFNHILKDPNFLRELSKYPSDNIMGLRALTFRNALNVLKTPSSETLIQAFVTLNLFEHFYKLGSRNPFREQALQQFHPNAMVAYQINPSTFHPSAYISEEGVFISNFAEEWIQFIPKRTDEDDLLIKVENIMSDLNNSANGIQTKDASHSYRRISQVMFLIHMMPVLFVPLALSYSG